MKNSRLSITLGINDKPVASDKLKGVLENLPDVEGEFLTGYPVIASLEEKLAVDAILISPSKGIILFDLIEGSDIGDYDERQDDLATKIQAKLMLDRELIRKKTRDLKIPINTISFAPAIQNFSNLEKEDYPIVNTESLGETLKNLPEWEKDDDSLYHKTLSSIQGLRGIRNSRSKREVSNDNSRGAKLKKLEDSIATLDSYQSKAVIETAKGIQRIRGLAGSGKTIVLAKKAAYLHTQHPEWRIAVTFNTRALKGQFQRLITQFCIEQAGEEPDWSKLRIINAWGGAGGETRDGIYYEYCRITGNEFLDFGKASRRFSDNPFDGACRLALDNRTELSQVYDVILIDEAQDFSPSFLKLCYAMLRSPKRLVYAYDELQNLSGTSLPSPEEIFGGNVEGLPVHDIILQKCYRNSRPVLVSAHGLGFGIYRQVENDSNGLVQMFDYPKLWEEIGYIVKEGELQKGSHVILERDNKSSPEFLENHSEIDDLIQFMVFDDEQEQNQWLVEQIKINLEKDELNHNDIVVINPDPSTARQKTGDIRRMLFDLQIQTHLAGVDTNPDVFFREDMQSVTFTGIYRAKGNEAGMVYVINAQDCNGSGAGLATLRNRLFTAITRAKAWVRVIGYGSKMKELENEFNRLKSKQFVLDFTYPNNEILSKLRIVHRDLSPNEKQKLEQNNRILSNLVTDLVNGDFHIEDMDEQTKNKLLDLLKG